MNMMKLVAGLDIGNGYVKGAVNTIDKLGTKPQGIDFPSGVARIIYSHDIQAEPSDAKPVIDDIFNQMDVSFGSNLVSDTTRRLFGKRGLASGSIIEEFDVDSVLSKAQQDLSGVLVLGSIAGQALKEYYNKTGELPKETIPVSVRIALALPITEYMRYRKPYAEGFKSGRHMVTFHNFTVPVNVEIRFEDVQVLAEGASAQFAIVQHGEPLVSAMLQELRAHGEKLEGVTAADVIGASNTIGVDIGEGTVNFPVFQDGKFNPDVSITFNKGYGTVLEQARERLQMLGMPFPSRKALADFLMAPQSALTAPRRNKAEQVVDEEIEGFVQELGVQFLKVMSRVGSYTEVIYVYGGGAVKVKNQLYPALLHMAKQFGGDDVIYPILYLDSEYSRLLNQEGLFIIAKNIADQASAQQ